MIIHKIIPPTKLHRRQSRQAMKYALAHTPPLFTRKRLIAIRIWAVNKYPAEYLHFLLQCLSAKSFNPQELHNSRVSTLNSNYTTTYIRIIILCKIIWYCHCSIRIVIINYIVSSRGIVAKFVTYFVFAGRKSHETHSKYAQLTCIWWLPYVTDRGIITHVMSYI